jgi:hypothetical protein
MELKELRLRLALLASPQLGQLPLSTRKSISTCQGFTFTSGAIGTDIIRLRLPRFIMVEDTTTAVGIMAAERSTAVGRDSQFRTAFASPIAVTDPLSR